MTYPIRYSGEVNGWSVLLREAREAGRSSQEELARRAGTSRPTLSAYEHGRKAPTADTLERLLVAAGFRLDAVPIVAWREVPLGRGRSCWVPDRLWRLPVADAFAEVVLPLELNWSAPGRRVAMADRRERTRLYEVLLREGAPRDFERWVDGALLVDAWADVVVPRGIRQAWQPVMEAATMIPVTGTRGARGVLGAAS
jgi:transcriptional regulator with XRE-family HTH domain